MSTPEYVEAAIERSHKLQSLLRILSQAVDGEQIAGDGQFAFNGGGSVIEMAADMALEITDGLETGANANTEKVEAA